MLSRSRELRLWRARFYLANCSLSIYDIKTTAKTVESGFRRTSEDFVPMSLGAILIQCARPTSPVAETVDSTSETFLSPKASIKPQNGRVSTLIMSQSSGNAALEAESPCASTAYVYNTIVDEPGTRSALCILGSRLAASRIRCQREVTRLELLIC